MFYKLPEYVLITYIFFVFLVFYDFNFFEITISRGSQTRGAVCNSCNSRTASPGPAAAGYPTARATPPRSPAMPGGRGRGPVRRARRCRTAAGRMWRCTATSLKKLAERPKTSKFHQIQVLIFHIDFLVRF